MSGITPLEEKRLRSAIRKGYLMMIESEQKQLKEEQRLRKIIQKLLQEAEIKKQLMQLEFNYNMQLKGTEVEGQKEKEKLKEDRKDERTKIQATQQSELIDQRKTGTPPKQFESAGNDILTGDFDLGMYDPK